jgi:S1-C subfamily serine protease
MPSRSRPLDTPADSSHPSPGARLPVNRLAVASLITAVVGIPLFGVVTGFVAILLASVALSRIQASRQKGLGLAVAGLLLGIVDMISWVAALSYALSGQSGVFLSDGVEPGFSSADVSPKIYRAMQANVLIHQPRGLWGVATGSGVILDVSKGSALIVTNRHVVDPRFPSRSAPPDLEELSRGGLSVKVLNGPTRPGRVTWMAPDGIDLALVRVEYATGDAKAALWATDQPMRVGDPVFAIGNPQRLDWTHTQGVISQFRSMTLNGQVIRVIQTQTAINPGNSGGGLYNDQANLIGINTWASDSRSGEGLNFAISFDSLLALDPPGLPPRPVAKVEKGVEAQ